VTGAEIVFKNMCFEMHGMENEIRAAITMILELDVIKVKLLPVCLSFDPLTLLSAFPSRDSRSDRACK
jgi:hypothetical protein